MARARRTNVHASVPIENGTVLFRYAAVKLKPFSNHFNQDIKWTKDSVEIDGTRASASS